MARLYEHWKQVPSSWDAFPAKYFTPNELACKGSGSILVVPSFVEALDRLRSSFSGPLQVNSSYRSPRHNALVGGSPLSRHKAATAADLSTVGLDRDLLLRLAIKYGFNGIGKYRTFLHVDHRKRGATWGSW